ncbi:hypothetical protein R1sor_000594 [Riccia sorocarpa]|uniref:BTB domain-containing protein n=1 Tax=Riccia sorocarpa TaxID=122646 RepID=A0ABD3GVX8_9MARC
MDYVDNILKASEATGKLTVSLGGRVWKADCNCCRRSEKICIEQEAAHSLSETIERLVELQNSLEKKLRFLQAFEPGPLSKYFRGDICFVGSDQEPIYAHRFIMEGKSTVFQKMFQTDMKEKESGTVRINDATSHVLRSMVNFCYTANIEFTEEASAEEMLKIGHKYDIKDLRDVCDEELCKDIDVDNLCKRLMLAHIYEAKKLGEFTAEFFHGNFPVTYPRFVERLCRDSPIDAE